MSQNTGRFIQVVCKNIVKLTVKREKRRISCRGIATGQAFFACQTIANAFYSRDGTGRGRTSPTDTGSPKVIWSSVSALSSDCRTSARHTGNGARKPDLKPRTPARFGIYRQSSTVFLNDFVGNEQSQTGSTLTFGGVEGRK